MRIRLTDVAIRQFPLAETGQRKIRDEILPGFGLIVGKRTKSFFVMYGKDRRTKTLGQWPDVTLKDARQEAKRILASPTPVRRSVSLSEAREAFLQDSYRRLRKSTADRYHYALKDISAPSLDKIPLEVTDATQLKTLKVFFNWCVDHDLIDTNPFARRKVVFAERDRVLSDEEVADVWQYEAKPYSDIVKMLLLTGQRRAQFADFDHDWIKDDNIVFPSAIMKSGREHILPFLPEWEPYLPTASSNSWSKNKIRMDKATGVTGYVIHDCRRYFSTTAAKLGIPLHVTELVLDHRSELSGVARVYNRYQFLPEMHDALRTYLEHLSSTVLRQV